MVFQGAILHFHDSSRECTVIILYDYDYANIKSCAEHAEPSPILGPPLLSCPIPGLFAVGRFSLKLLERKRFSR